MAKNYFSYLFLFLCIFLSANINAQQTSSLINTSNNKNSTLPPPIYHDYGDAPNSYLTDAASGGPAHMWGDGMPMVIIGQTVDFENGAFPSTDADGDDLNSSQDEDGINPSDLEGISITTDIFSIDVEYGNNSSSLDANLYAWIDFDRSGFFDEDEFASVLDLKPGEGVATLTWSNLVANGVDVIEGISYARFRITTGNLTSADVGGIIATGEVEDYVLVIGDNTLGVDDEILAEGLNLYPNPVSNTLLVESKVKLNKIEIYSILGQRVKEVNSDFNSISTDNLSRGIYMIKIYSEKGTTVRKLIKQ